MKVRHGALLAALLVLSGCGAQPAVAPARVVLLVTLDTTRDDRVGATISGRRVTPNIDRVIDEALRFERCYSPAPLTLPAHSTLMTGLLPPEHGVRNNIRFRLPGSVETLAELAAAAGWRTEAVVSSFVLDSSFGVAQGFEHYDDTMPSRPSQGGFAERTADSSVSRAIERLELADDRPLFLWLHLFDPHRPYEAPSEVASQFERDPYSAEVSFCDRELGRLFDGVRGMGLWDEAWVVIVGDHGEMLGEHGEQTHGYTVYESAVRVPLVVKTPRELSSSARRISAPVALDAVTGILARALAVDPPNGVRGWQAEELRSPEERLARGEPIYAESMVPTLYRANPLRSVVVGSWKLIHRLEPELYNVVDDPEERHNLARQENDRVCELTGVLRDIVEGSGRRREGAETGLDREAAEQLQALGYVSGEIVDSGFALDPDLADPMDVLALHTTVARIEPMISLGRLDEALELCQEAIDLEPSLVEPHVYLGEVAMTQGRPEVAVGHLRRALDLDPDRYETLSNLAVTLIALGRADEARILLDRAVEVNPDREQAHANLAALALQNRDFPRAEALARRALECNPEYPEALATLGVALSGLGRAGDAVAALEAARRRRPDDASIAVFLARVRIDSGEPREAVAILEPIWRRQPASLPLVDALSAALRASGDPDRADQCWEEAIRAHPTSAELLHQAAVSAFNAGDSASALRWWQRALAVEGDHLESLNGAAWLLATTGDDALRSPDRAVELATRSCSITGYGVASYIDTLAAAYAADGDFDRALRVAEQAAAVARSQGEADLLLDIIQRRDRYLDGRAHVERLDSPRRSPATNVGVQGTGTP